MLDSCRKHGIRLSRPAGRAHSQGPLRPGQAGILAGRVRSLQAQPGRAGDADLFLRLPWKPDPSQPGHRRGSPRRPGGHLQAGQLVGRSPHQPAGRHPRRRSRRQDPQLDHQLRLRHVEGRLPLAVGGENHPLLEEGGRHRRRPRGQAVHRAPHRRLRLQHPDLPAPAPGSRAHHRHEPGTPPTCGGRASIPSFSSRPSARPSTPAT